MVVWFGARNEVQGNERFLSNLPWPEGYNPGRGWGVFISASVIKVLLWPNQSQENEDRQLFPEATSSKIINLRSGHLRSP